MNILKKMRIEIIDCGCVLIFAVPAGSRRNMWHQTVEILNI
jgi:hypothetical protein